MSFNTIPEGIESIRQGEILVVVDDPDRENEGDLVMAAEKATPEAINFMAKYGRGMICLPATSQRLKELELFEMVSDNLGDDDEWQWVKDFAAKTGRPVTLIATTPAAYVDNKMYRMVEEA